MEREREQVVSAEPRPSDKAEPQSLLPSLSTPLIQRKLARRLADRRAQRDGAGQEQASGAGAEALDAADAPVAADPVRAPARLGPSGSHAVQLQPAPQQPAPQQLIKELQDLIAKGAWPTPLRDELYPKNSAPAIQRAKDRRDPAKKVPDLTGLGSIKSLDHFAAVVKTIQADWANLGKSDPQQRARKLFEAANFELKSAKVFPLRAFLVRDMIPRGEFDPGGWIMTFQKAMIENPTLSDQQAADLCNTTLHEARHCEQAYLAARLEGEQPGKFAADVVNDQGIHGDAAIAAVQSAKLNKGPKLKGAELALAQQMFQSNVTDADANGKIEIQIQKQIEEMRTANATAQAKLAALNANATAPATAEATTARDALKDKIEKVRQAYAAYRNIPAEADAHEVGDSAELAFKNLP